MHKLLGFTVARKSVQFVHHVNPSQLSSLNVPAGHGLVSDAARSGLGAKLLGFTVARKSVQFGGGLRDTPTAWPSGPAGSIGDAWWRVGMDKATCPKKGGLDRLFGTHLSGR
jgi:hypothetical protein